MDDETFWILVVAFVFLFGFAAILLLFFFPAWP